MRISVPSKTFLIGEYVALDGGEALILATEPRFSLAPGESNFQPHPDSAAARAWPELTTPVDFLDPHSGAGGFGASSAQYLMAKCYAGPQSVESLVTEYRALHQGSGYDLAAQCLGRVARVCSQKSLYSSLPWNLKGFDFLIFRTGYKLETHLGLDVSNLDVKSLAHVSEAAVSAYIKGDAFGFLEGLSDFSSLLEIQGFVTKTTLDILVELESDSEILLAKGCGAMGADTVLAMVSTENLSSVQERWQSQLDFIGSSSHLSHGLRFDTDPVVAVES